jgi:hypothetical protein
MSAVAQAKRALATFALGLTLSLILAFCVASAAVSLGDACLIDAPSSAGQISQRGGLFPPRLTCIYSTDGGELLQERDGQAQSRALGVVVAGVVAAGAFCYGSWRIWRGPRVQKQARATVSTRT